jgi:UDP-arabinose 4-epimerase
MTSVLVTGGAGFIGSHTCKALKTAGFESVVVDNLSTGHQHNVRWSRFAKVDVRDRPGLDEVFRHHEPEAVIHFAASAYVGESVTDPAKYYSNNVAGMRTLLDAAAQAGVKHFIFSSSCATYGIVDAVPIAETTPQSPINPYGRTKLICEWMLSDYAARYGMKYVALRYFNAAGADPDGELKEEHAPETHLIPLAILAAIGKRDRLSIFGNDYPTPDGTCVRDYIHVSDLADAHVQACQYLLSGGDSVAVNLGGGKGHSICEVIAEIEAIADTKVPFAFAPRRPGDPPILVADTSLAQRTIGFQPRRSSLSSVVSSAVRSMANSL